MNDDIQDPTAYDDNGLLVDAIMESGLPDELDSKLTCRPIGSEYHAVYSSESAPNVDSTALAIERQRQRTRDEYKKIIAWIYELAKLALASTEKPVVHKLQRGFIVSLDLSKLAQSYIHRFPVMVEVVRKFASHTTYDEYIEVFRRTCSELCLYEEGLLQEPPLWVNLANNPLSHTAERCAEIFNTFIETLRRLGRETNATRRRTERLRNAKECYQDYCEYFDALITRYRRLVAVRVELGYQKEGLQHSMVTLRKDFDAFLRNKRSEKEINPGLVGYIAKFECGVDRGPHIHLVIFFDGDKRQSCAKFFAQNIGEYWERITGERGNYRNGHLNDGEYERRGTLGIGLIRADDHKKRENFCKYVLSYLCKADSFARPQGLNGFRVIRRGTLRTKQSPRKKIKRSSQIQTSSPAL